MKWFREGIWITSSFIVTLIVTGGVSFTSYQNSVQLINNINNAQQTNKLLDTLTDISALLADAESRKWSYILLDDPQEFIQYQQSVERLQSNLSRLRQPLTDTPDQIQRLDLLEKLINERLDLFESAIAQYSGRKMEISQTDPLIMTTQTNLSLIRQTINTLEEKEETIILMQLEEIRTNSRIRLVIEPIGTMLTFVILLGSFALLYRQLLKRQQIEATQKLLTQEKELSELKIQLFSMVSHEFRTPLSLILGSSQILEKNLKNIVESERLKSLYRIQSSAKIMTQLLNDILTISRADAGKLEFNPKWIEIQTFCLNLIEDFQVSLLTKRSLFFKQKNPCTYAYVDEKLLYSILSNLLSNAVKFSPEHSNINLNLLKRPDEIIFQVCDQGIGIPEDDISMLYAPFCRGRNTGNTKGTGLGLAVVQRCLALHQGTISVKSDVGLGTTFTVTLPQPTIPPTLNDALNSTNNSPFIPA